MPCITLLSDLGLQDASVAIARGILMQHTRSMDIIDITHEIMPFHAQQAAYLLGCAYKNFPEGSCHILLFNLFSEVIPKLVLSEYNNHYFLSPDNGVVPLAIGAVPGNTWLCPELKKENAFSDWIGEAGRIINLLQTKKPGETGLPVYELNAAPLQPLTILHTGNTGCSVIHIDNYENVVVNISKQQFEKISNGRPFRLQFMRVEEITEISSSYNDVREGYKLCRFNSNGFLEICINRGKAASLFGLRLGGSNNDIKLIFE